MPQVPFPHVLSSDLELGRGVIRIVTPEVMGGGKMQVQEKDGLQMNKKTQNMEMVFNIYLFDSIDEQRPARGDWSNWELHPTFYKGRGKVKRVFESEIEN